MNNILKVLLIILCFLSLSTDIFTQTQLYLGQTPPTVIVKRFPPTAYLATSTWMWHGPPVFSKSGKEMFWVKYYRDDSGTEIWFTRFENGVWITPQKASFSIKSTRIFDNNPIYSDGDDTIYFNSNRGASSIYYVTRTAGGWSTPSPIIIPRPPNTTPGLQFAVTKNKTIYFELTDTLVGFKPDIYKSTLVDGNYTMPEKLGPSINTASNELVGYVDPLDRFMIFCSNRPGSIGYHDLYFSKKDSLGEWTESVNLSSINGTFEDVAPFISPDGKYLFFNTAKSGDIGYNPYWRSANFIFDMITGIKENKVENKDFNLFQNFPNPFNPETTIKYELKKGGHIKLSIFDLAGKLIRSLVDSFQGNGSYSVVWDGKDNNGVTIAGGVYFYQLQSESVVILKKSLLIK